MTSKDNPDLHTPEDLPKGDPAPSDAGAPETLSVLFLAATFALLALLGAIGVIAYVALSR